MSKALEFLLRTRPEAMGAYFDFIRRAGDALDPRTRAIISVISKAANRTEAGLRQYVRRALNEGVSFDELLDALLFAFPILGLSNIIWAVDIMLDMDLPGVRSDVESGPGWHTLAALSELPAHGVVCRSLDKRRFLIHVDEEGIRVYDARCPHRAMPMTEEDVIDDTLTCPNHGWKFSLTTGACIQYGQLPLNRIVHRVEEESVRVLLSSGT